MKLHLAVTLFIISVIGILAAPEQIKEPENTMNSLLVLTQLKNDKVYKNIEQLKKTYADLGAQIITFDSNNSGYMFSLTPTPPFMSSDFVVHGWKCSSEPQSWKNFTTFYICDLGGGELSYDVTEGRVKIIGTVNNEYLNRIVFTIMIQK